MSRRNIALIVIAALLGGLVLQRVASGVLQPLFAVGWVGGLLTEVIGQSLIWGVAAIVAGIALLRAIFPREMRPVRRDPPPPERTREQAIARLVNQAGRDGYARWRLAHRLAEQATQALALRDGLTADAARQRLQQDAAPPDLRSYLQAGLRQYETGRGRLPIAADDAPQRAADWISSLIEDKEQDRAAFDR